MVHGSRNVSTRRPPCRSNRGSDSELDYKFCCWIVLPHNPGNHGNYCLLMLLLLIQDALYPYSLLVFAGLCGLFWLFTCWFVPETKGRTVEDIVNNFKSSTPNNKSQNRCLLY